MKGETCASSIVEDLLDEFRRGTGLHRKVNLGGKTENGFSIHSASLQICAVKIQWKCIEKKMS